MAGSVIIRPRDLKLMAGIMIKNVDGHDICAASGHHGCASRHRQTLSAGTTIGWGSPNMAGTAITHGAALGEKEVAAVRSHLSWPHEPFLIDESVYASWDARKSGAIREMEWNNLFSQYQERYPELASEFLRRMENRFPENWQEQAQAFLQELNEKKQSVATRKASQFCLDKFANVLPEMMGGSADLTESNCTNWQGMKI